MKFIRDGFAALWVLALVAAALPAQGAKGEASAARIAVGGGSPAVHARAVLGSAEVSEASVDAIRDSRFSADLATAVTAGTTDRPGAASVATVTNLSILKGLVTAASVVAVATASTAGVDATGSGFEDLRVNGVAMPANPAPNTRVELPGVGYVVLNEQRVEGGTITVNMIRLVQTTGAGSTRAEIVIASARSGQ